MLGLPSQTKQTKREREEREREKRESERVGEFYNFTWIGKPPYPHPSQIGAVCRSLSTRW